jgi:hypothetical protein
MNQDQWDTVVLATVGAVAVGMALLAWWIIQ